MDLSDFYRAYHDHKPGLLGSGREYAVLVPLVETAQGLYLLYEVRSAGIRQPHEVCFPGGRMESGETPTFCALRETQEELGILPEDITVLGLPDFLHLRSEALMHPVLAGLDSSALRHISPNPDEVADTFLISVQWLLDHPPTLYRYPLRPMVEPDFPYDEVHISPAYPWDDGQMEVPVYRGLPYPLWGLTARITYYLLKNMQDKT